MKNTEFQLLLGLLLHQKLQYIERTLNLVCLGFGKLLERKDRHSVTDEIAEYSIHIQCPFRILLNNKIVLGSDDLFLSQFPDIESVDLNIKDSCLFDYKSKSLIQKFNNEIIIGVDMNKQNDLILYTSNLTIQLFVCNNQFESWRFFKFDDESIQIVIDEDNQGTDD